MIDLTPLTQIKRYGVNVWLHAFRNLFPQGLLWKWPLADESMIDLNGIASSESFGLPLISGAPWIYPHSIISAEAFGYSNVQRFIQPDAVLSAEDFGALTASNLPFHIRDDFDNGFLPYWNSDFTDDWSIVQREPFDAHVAVRGSNGDDRLTPAGVGYSGDFELYTAINLNDPETGNTSLHIYVYQKSNDTLICDFMYEFQTLHFGGGVNIIVYPPSSTLVKLRRISGVITVSAFLGGTWKDVTQWSTPGTPYNNSNDVYFVVNGADVNGFEFFELTAAGVS